MTTDHDVTVLTPDLLHAWRLELHDRECRRDCPHRNHTWHLTGLTYVHASAAEKAVDHLLANPRDAAGARLILHDSHCMSDTHTAASRTEHAKTWATTVAALRKAIATVGPT